MQKQTSVSQHRRQRFLVPILLLGIIVLFSAVSTSAQAVQIKLFISSGVVSGGANRSSLIHESFTDSQGENWGLDGLFAASSGSHSVSVNASAPGLTATSSASVSWSVNQPAHQFVDAAAISGVIRFNGNSSNHRSSDSEWWGGSSAGVQANLLFQTDGGTVTANTVSSLGGAVSWEGRTFHFRHVDGVANSESRNSSLSFSFNGAPLPGTLFDHNPLPPFPGPSNRPSAMKVQDTVNEDDEQPPPARQPAYIAGINLTANLQQLAAATAETEERIFPFSQFGSPVVTGGYGDTDLVYHRGSTEQEIAPDYTTGYLFLNDQGGNFTSFTIPEALPGGDSQFRINLDGQGFDLAAGDVFDFTTFDTNGVDSFLVVGIDESETISPQVDMPFTIGVTTLAGSDASFLAVPVISVKPGDFNLDGNVDFADIDALAAAVLASSTDIAFDLDGDGDVDFNASALGVSSDSDFLIRTILNTEYGDANLDGEVDILDLDLLGQGFRGLGSGWLFGDFDGSGGSTGINDLTILGETFGFPELPPVVTVPEPTSWGLVCVAVGLLVMGRSRNVLARHATVRSMGRSMGPCPVRCAKNYTGQGPVLRWFLAVACLALASNAHADLVVTYLNSHATVTVTPTAPVPGFITYTFSAEPSMPMTEIASFDASFSTTTPTTMRQVNPGGSPTVFNDLNGSFPLGEVPAGDSQFLFSILGGDVLAVLPTESNTSLSAKFTFTGAPLIQFGVPQPFAQVVLPVGEFGTADFEIVVSVLDSPGLGGEIATFPNLSFGGLTAVPEASTVLCWSLLALVAAGRNVIVRRHSARAAKSI